MTTDERYTEMFKDCVVKELFADVVPEPPITALRFSNSRVYCVRAAFLVQPRPNKIYNIFRVYFKRWNVWNL